MLKTCREPPGYLVEVRSRFSFNCSEFSYRLLLDGYPEVVAVLYPGDEQLNPHFDLQQRGKGFKQADEVTVVDGYESCDSPCYISL